MNHNTYHKNGWLRHAATVAAAAIGGAAIIIYNPGNIRDLFQPRAPVAQVYNKYSCLAYDGKTYVLFKGTALKGDGIDKLLLRHNPRPHPTLEDAFRAANGMETSMLREGRQYRIPAPDKENKCK